MTKTNEPALDNGIVLSVSVVVELVLIDDDFEVGDFGWISSDVTVVGVVCGVVGLLDAAAVV